MSLLKANNIFLSNSFFIFITRFFPSLANLVVMVWYSRHLSPSAYGAYQQFWVQLYVIYPVICFGIHSLIITYSRGILANIISRFKTKQYVLFVCWVLALSAGFGALQHSVGGVSFTISMLFILSFAISIITESLLIVFRKYATVSITGFLYAAAFCWLHWFALETGFSIQKIFAFLLIINLLRVFVYSITVIMAAKKDGEGYEHEDIDVPKVRSLWLHLGVYDIVQMLSTWVDKFVIALLLTSELSAIYYNGAQNIPFLPLLLTAAGSAVLMQLADGNSRDETKNTIALVNQMGRVLSSIVFPVFFFLFIFRNELIVTLLSEQYIPAIPIFAISVLILPVRAYSFTTVLQRQHKGNIINIGAIAELLLAAAMMYPLYQLMGLPGVALSFIISTYLQAGFYLLYAGKLLGVNPISLIPLGNWLAKLIIFACVFIVIHYMGSIYYTGKFTLILGALAMVLLVAVSLLLEIRLQKKHGNTPATA